MPTEDQCELPSSLSHTLGLMNPSGFIPWCHIFILFSNSPQVCFHFRCPKYILPFNSLHSWKSSRILFIGSILLSWGKTADVSLIVCPQHGQSMRKKQFPSSLFIEYVQRSLKPLKYSFPLFVYSMWTFLQTCLNLIIIQASNKTDKDDWPTFTTVMTCTNSSYNHYHLYYIHPK